MTLNPERARELGRRSGQARRKLTLDDVTTELGALDSLEDATRWLRQVALWGASGLIHGTVLHGLVRAVEVWVRTHESKLTEQVVNNLRKRLEELEGQLKQKGGER